MQTENYFNESLTFLIDEIEPRVVMEKLADELFEKGYVKKTFKDAVFEREKTFPTGLPTENIGVALPHTDSVHVEKAAIAVGILKSPVTFNQMGAEYNEVQVQLVFMLGIKDPSTQVEVLQKLIELIQNEHVIRQIMNSSSEQDVVALLKDFSKSA